METIDRTNIIKIIDLLIRQKLNENEIDVENNYKKLVYYNFIFSKLLRNYKMKLVDIAVILNKDRSTIKYYLNTYADNLEFTNNNLFKLANKIITELEELFYNYKNEIIGKK